MQLGLHRLMYKIADKLMLQHKPYELGLKSYQVEQPSYLIKRSNHYRRTTSIGKLESQPRQLPNYIYSCILQFVQPHWLAWRCWPILPNFIHKIDLGQKNQLMVLLRNILSKFFGSIKGKKELFPSQDHVDIVS